MDLERTTWFQMAEAKMRNFRPAPTSSSSAVQHESEADDGGCCRHGGGLLKWNQVPTHLKFNPYIHDGYRPLANSTGCLKSLAYWHNESVNILTHGLPVLYIAIYSPTLIPWSDIDVPILPYTHLLGIFCPWFGSFIYHTFMNHTAGDGVYRRLLQLDMLGIWVTQSIGALTTVFAAVYCFSPLFRMLITLFYALTCLWGLYKAVKAGSSGSPWDRRFCFFLPILIRLGLVGMRSSGYASGHPASLPYIWLQDLIAIFGGVIGALRIPEKWFPGKFDYWFNSHHIMHVLVLVAVVQMHYAAKMDLIWLTNPQCENRFHISQPHPPHSMIIDDL